MRVSEEIANPRIPQHFIHSRSVATLRQPDALRPFTEMAGEFAGPDFDLSPDRVGIEGHQRQEAMRRRAGNQLQFTRLVETSEAVEQIVAVLVDEDLPRPLETLLVHVGQGTELRLPAGTYHLLARQSHEVVEMAKVAVLQEWIAEHAGQGRRNRHRQSPIHAVALQAIENLQERDIRFGDRFVEPVLFEEILVLRMTDVRQMGVQYQAEMTKRHRHLSMCSRSRGILSLGFNTDRRGKVQGAGPRRPDRREPPLRCSGFLDPLSSK